MDNRVCLRNLFRSFVCATLSLLLFFHFYAYVWGPPLDSNGDLSDIKYVIMQLTRGLTEWHGKVTTLKPEVKHSAVEILWRLWRDVAALDSRQKYAGLILLDIHWVTLERDSPGRATKVNRKHEQLQNEMERMSAVIPAATAAASRGKDALQPSRRNNRHALDIHDYDRQVADYALESAGGRVVDTGDTVEHMIYESPVGWALHLLTAMVCRECQGARVIIRPGTLPGECWAFKGSKGEVTIRLLGTVQVTGLSVEHIPAHISPTREISSAPRLFQVEGLEYRADPYPHDFGTFEYDTEGKPIQYFEVLQPSTKGFNLVRVNILSNWGHPVYTCLYRLRVHGELVSGQVPHTPTMDEGDLFIENE